MTSRSLKVDILIIVNYYQCSFMSFINSMVQFQKSTDDQFSIQVIFPFAVCYRNLPYFQSISFIRNIIIKNQKKKYKISMEANLQKKIDITIDFLFFWLLFCFAYLSYLSYLFFCFIHVHLYLKHY